MHVTVDRIEDKRTAVVTVLGGGQMFLPVKLFSPGLREGQIFDVTWAPNREAEQTLRSEIMKLQGALLKRSRKR